MNTLPWSHDYVLDIPSIDNEHRLLVSLINDMSLAMLYQGDLQTRAINESLDRLGRYVRCHFDSEERFLLINNYPEFDLHKEQHEDLLRQYEKFESTFHREKDPFSPDMLLFLKDWLVRHIILHDCKFAHYYRDQEILNHHAVT